MNNIKDMNNIKTYWSKKRSEALNLWFGYFCCCIVYICDRYQTFLPIQVAFFNSTTNHQLPSFNPNTNHHHLQPSTVKSAQWRHKRSTSISLTSAGRSISMCTRGLWWLTGGQGTSTWVVLMRRTSMSTTPTIGRRLITIRPKVRFICIS